MSPFSFSLSHTLTVFFSIFLDYTSQAETLSFLCFLLSLELTQNGQKMALYFLQLPLRPNGLCFFFSFPSACPTRLASLLIKRSQTSPMLWSFLNKWKELALKTFGTSSWMSFDKCVWWNLKGVTCIQQKCVNSNEEPLLFIKDWINAQFL